MLGGGILAVVVAGSSWPSAAQGDPADSAERMLSAPASPLRPGSPGLRGAQAPSSLWNSSATALKLWMQLLLYTLSSPSPLPSSSMSLGGGEARVSLGTAGCGLPMKSPMWSSSSSATSFVSSWTAGLGWIRALMAWPFYKALLLAAKAAPSESV